MTTEELYRQYAGFVARFLARLSVPAEYLEDALQEVFLVVHRNGGYRPGLAKPTSYLANMAIHAASKHRRRQATARKRQTLEPVERIASGAHDLGHQLQVRRDLERLRLALEQLPEELRTTLLLVEMEGESCVSVAAGLNCPVGTIYSRLHAARKRLHVALRAGAARSNKSHNALDGQGLPTWSWTMVIGFGAFRKSEAARLLQLAREQAEPQLPIDELLLRLQELQRAQALPSWASNCAPPATTWLSVVGAPAAVSLTAAMVAMGAALLVRAVPTSVPPPHESSHEQVAHAQARAGNAVGDQPTPLAEAARLSYEPRAPSASQQPTTERRAHAARARPRRAQTAPVRVRYEASSGARSSSLSPVAVDKSSVTGEGAASSKQSELEEPVLAREPEPQPRPAEPTERETAPTNLDPELAEIRAIEEAEQELANDPARTLELTRSMHRRYADGNLREERAYLEVMALHKLGRAVELRAKASQFVLRYPSGVFSARVRRVSGEVRR